MRYEIIAYRRYIGYDKVYLSVEADSPEEAMQIVREAPEEYEEDSKLLDISNSEYVAFSDWEVR